MQVLDTKSSKYGSCPKRDQPSGDRSKQAATLKAFLYTQVSMYTEPFGTKNRITS